MNDEAILPTPLESHHIRALRNADQIVFRHHDGQSTVEAIRAARNSRTGFDEAVVIFAESAFTDYGANYLRGEPDSYEAFHMEHAAKFNPAVVTVLRHLRAGDVLRLRWTLDNNTDTIRRADLHQDELFVEVRRSERRIDAYMIESAVRLDNSARMIRRRNTAYEMK